MSTSSSGTSTYSHTEQSLIQELSLKQIFQIIFQNWLLFVILFFSAVVFSLSIYKFKVPYISQASIVVNDSQNSSLQSFATEFFGLSKRVSDGKKSNSPLAKHFEYLKTTDYYNQLFQFIIKDLDIKNLSVSEKNGFEIFKKSINFDSSFSDEQKNKVLVWLDQHAKSKIESDFELKISFAADEPEVALFLTKAATDFTVQKLKEREMSDIVKVEDFINQQKNVAEENMKKLNLQLTEFQNKTENIISLSSKDKVADYLSELLVRQNEIKMKIAENQKIIDYLSTGNKAQNESQLYGNGGKIQKLKLENKLLQSQLLQVQTSVQRVSQMAKGIPLAGQLYEDLKKKSQIEFDKYKNLTESLQKAEVQKLSVASRFEVMESPRIDKVKPQISLTLLILIAFVFSQIMGCFIIYLGSIWDTNTFTAKSSRNVVIINSDNLDPRIVVEDSKIKFRLKGSSSSDLDETHKLAPQKLTFRLFSKKDALIDNEHSNQMI